MTTALQTAHILVKRTPTDREFQRFLVRDNEGFLELWHNDSGKWVALPSAWDDEARVELRRANAKASR